jgi:hypothetical protein
MRSRQTTVILLTFLAGLILWRTLDFGEAVNAGVTPNLASSSVDDDPGWEIEESLRGISNATLGVGAAPSRQHIEREREMLNTADFNSSSDYSPLASGTAWTSAMP